MRPLNLSMRVALPVVAIAIGLSGISSFAQPGPGGAPWRNAAAAGDGEGTAIIRLRSRLNLSADQSAALDAIVANAKAQAQALRAAAQPTLAQITAELAKTQPSLQTLAQLRDSLQPGREALRKATRDQLIGFYGTLTPTQQQVVIDALRKMAARQAERAAKHLGQ